METHTKKVEIQEEEACFLATASYELNVNGVRCASCDIRVLVQPRKTFRLEGT